MAWVGAIDSFINYNRPRRSDLLAVNQPQMIRLYTPLTELGVAQRLRTILPAGTEILFAGDRLATHTHPV